MRRAVCVASVCVASVAALVGAQAALATPAWLAPVDLSASAQNELGPDVALDGAGDAIGVWDRSNGSNSIVQASLRPAGGTFGTPVDLSATGRDADEARVAADSAGDAVAVWRRYDGSRYIIQASVRPAGGSFGEPVDLSASGQNAADPQIALDPAGNAIAIWSRSDGTHTIVQATVRPAGGAFGMPVDLSASGQSADWPQLAFDQAGEAIAVWQRSNGTRSIAQAAVRPAGGSFGMPVDLSGTDLDANVPQVAVDAAGDAVVVFQHQDDFMASNSTVQAVVRPAGGSFGPPIDLSTPSGGAYSVQPQVAVDPAGDAVVVWVRVGGDYRVQAAARPAGGSFAALGDVGIDGGIATPQVEMDQAGDAFVTFQGYRDGDPHTAIKAAVRPAGAASAPRSTSRPPAATGMLQNWRSTWPVRRSRSGSARPPICSAATASCRRRATTQSPRRCRTSSSRLPGRPACR